MAILHLWRHLLRQQCSFLPYIPFLHTIYCLSEKSTPGPPYRMWRCWFKFLKLGVFGCDAYKIARAIAATWVITPGLDVIRDLD